MNKADSGAGITGKDNEAKRTEPRKYGSSDQRAEKQASNHRGAMEENYFQ